MWNARRKTEPGDSAVPIHAEFEVSDTAFTKAERNLCEGETEVLANLRWEPGTFSASIRQEGDGDRSVHFPSPLPQGNSIFDAATMDWYFARDRRGEIKQAPAVVVLDILQGGNLVAGFIAKTLSKHGLHAFVLHLPQNGRRRKPDAKHDWSAFLPSLRQGAGDARRARDVVAGLPMVTATATTGVSLQGTSLGGFVATLAGSIDGVFDSTVLALTGGDVYGVLSQGKMDAARVRQHLRDAGYTDNKLREYLWNIEPLRVAHRLNAKKTWLFSARYDQVVPAPNGKKLAQAIGLDFNHHRQFAGCHYTCVISAPRLLSEMRRAIPAVAKPR
jgi:hypothetical protein